MITSYVLATLNATLNSAALVCVLLGYRAVRAGRITSHQRYMFGAFGLSVVFLASYLTRIVRFGDTHFAGQGAVRVVYFALLISHVLLAFLIAPGVVYQVFLGVTGRVERHQRLGRKLLPVCLYVLATAVLVYLFLYQF